MLDVAPLGLKVRYFEFTPDVSTRFNAILAGAGFNGSIAMLSVEEISAFFRANTPPLLAEALFELKNSEPDTLVIVGGIAELPWSEQRSDLVAADYARTLQERDAFLAFRSHWLVTGLFDLIGLRLMKTNVLVRPRPDGKISGPDAHRDMNPISALTTVCNYAPAETQFVDMPACLRSLAADFKQRFVFEPGAHGGYPITLSEFEVRLNELRFLGDGRVHALVPCQSNRNEDLAQYEAALSEFSVGLTIEPGTIVMWNTLYHRAMPAETAVAPIFGRFSRVALFWGGR
ncbi:hypothetical protein EPK99_23325 [Neorhizobium lilium]|uniref:Uncharacterized protein n=1 Tax=Neorhizobium lilium TaxID=2503024 RepID=A0A3S3TU39_9HYPH|nr:hypothetical protein [Neorhizobium lilium]RWX74829.1 hypothetical protein EPK99_23325 [Neorhizobium lilium]